MPKAESRGAETKKSPREKVKCSLCNYSAMAGYRMKRHMRIHTGEKPFMCGMCDQSFTQKSSLKEHLWKHTALQSCHKCPHCDARYHQQSDVSAHIGQMHTAVPAGLPCTVCAEVLPDRYTLLEHQKGHDNLFRYQCLECAFSSRDKAQLILHMSVHSKRRPLRCSACRIPFAHKHSLLSHLYQKHSINTFGDDFQPGEAPAPAAAQTTPVPAQHPAAVVEPPVKLTNQQELEQLYQIVDEHGNALQLSEADAAAIHSAVQQSSEEGTLQILQNTEECGVTVTVLTVAHDMDASVPGLVEGEASEAVVLHEVVPDTDGGVDNLLETLSTEETAPSAVSQ